MQVAPPVLLATAQVNCCIFSSLELLAHSLTEVSPFLSQFRPLTPYTSCPWLGWATSWVVGARHQPASSPAICMKNYIRSKNPGKSSCWADRPDQSYWVGRVQTPNRKRNKEMLFGFKSGAGAGAGWQTCLSESCYNQMNQSIPHYFISHHNVRCLLFIRWQSGSEG